MLGQAQVPAPWGTASGAEGFSWVGAGAQPPGPRTRAAPAPAPDAPHLGEVVLRELLLLQHGRALQRVRVDLLARDFLVLLSWKRGGRAVTAASPARQPAQAVLVGTPEARGLLLPCPAGPRTLTGQAPPRRNRERAEGAADPPPASRLHGSRPRKSCRVTRTDGTRDTRCQHWRSPRRTPPPHRQTPQMGPFPSREAWGWFSPGQ